MLTACGVGAVVSFTTELLQVVLEITTQYGRSERGGPSKLSL